jgi:hypothetical protein
MAALPHFVRPGFDDALNEWKRILDDIKLPTELLWVFDENLCFENDPAAPDRFRLGFQTRITPAPEDAERVAFDYFSEFPARLVFYRIGSSRDRSVCLVLCDEWFESKGKRDGFVKRDDWLMSFHPGDRVEIEEITDRERWQNRILRNRPLHDLDFCMTLRGVHEILAHGRVLTSYEHYALRFLHAWRRFMGESR